MSYNLESSREQTAPRFGSTPLASLELSHSLHHLEFPGNGRLSAKDRRCPTSPGIALGPQDFHTRRFLCLGEYLYTTGVV